MSEKIVQGFGLHPNEPFPDYQISSNQPGPVFYGIVMLYTILAFLLIVPLSSWSESQEVEKEIILDSDGKQVEIDQTNNPNQRRPYGDDNDKHDEPSPMKPNVNLKDSEEAYHHDKHVKNSPNGDQERDIKNQPSTSLGVLKKIQKPTNNTMGRYPSSAIASDNTDALTNNSRYTKSKTVISSRSSRSLRSVVLRELDQSYPDQDPDFQKRIALRMTMSGVISNAYPIYNQVENIKNTNAFQRDQEQSLHYTTNGAGDGSNQPTETSSSIPSGRTSSSVPSAATTGKIHQNTTAVKTNPSDKSFSKLVLDVGGRRWKNRRPIGRADVIENAFASNSERQLISNIPDSKNKKAGSLVGQDLQRVDTVPPRSTNNDKGEQSGIPQQLIHRDKSGKGMSDIASSILSEQYHRLNHQPQVQIDISFMKKHQLEQLRLQKQNQLQYENHFFAMQRLQQQQQQQRRYLNQRRYSRRAVSEKSASAMSSIVDDILPDDAPDANDPGRGNIFVNETGYGRGLNLSQTQEGCCSSSFENFLLSIALDFEKWYVFHASIPLALGASSEAFFRLVNIALISRYLGTESMIAFLLVGLFVRLTSEELSSAIIDSLSSFVQVSIDKTSIDANNNRYIAGQYIQLAFILQVMLNIPLLVCWVYYMERFVTWLVNDPNIASIAVEYASIIVVAYMVQALSRTLTVVFHICGHEHFESVIDLVAAAFQVIGIACVMDLVDGADLHTVGKIQVLINVASAIAKIAYPAARGWMRPIRRGLVQNVALWNHKIGIWHLVKAAAPLLLGTVLEYGEWELLTLFVHHLGPAEVATWALLGAFWDVFEALTEGIGEAAANQVASLLSAGQIDAAKKLCYGAIFMAATQAVLVTSALYMLGQYLAILVTTNPAMQHIMNENIVFLGLANIIMAFSQITWSLIGAQGRFRLATFAIFFSRWMVTMPCALISIYVFVLDLTAVSGSLVVGYVTASCALTVILFRSDWGRIARLMQVMNQPQFVASNVQHLAKYDAAEDEDANDPILGLVDLDNFDDSDDDSDGFGFGDYGEDNNGDENEAEAKRK